MGFRQGGTIFRASAGGQLTDLFTFAADQNGKFSDGSSPAAGLVEGRDGFLYGTTEFGGASNSGVLFRVETNGSSFHVLHNFCSVADCSDGGNPAAPLFQGTDGNLYGTTGTGGASGAGTIFRVSPLGSFTTLHNFSATEGTLPSGLIQASDGNFYGNVRRFGPLCGAAYRLSPAGQFAVLKHFPQPSECFPIGELIQASNGLLYGDTFYGEEFQISLSGDYQALGDVIPGGGLKPGPTGLTQASDGNLWGSSFSGSSNFSGSVFALSTSGSLVLKAFDCQASKLLQGADGKLYGASGACSDNEGNIFAVDAGLPAPKAFIANFAPAIAKVGTQIMIRGDHFVGTTTVSFNGVSTIFRVLNANYIAANVLSGATSGSIAVTNAAGTTKSASTFLVQ